MFYRAAVAAAAAMLCATPIAADPGQGIFKTSSVMHLNDSCTASYVGNGLVVTAAHCIRGLGEQSLELDDGTVIKGQVGIYSGAPAGFDDLAIIRISNADDRMDAMDIACHAPPPPVGHRVRMTGYPGSIGLMTVWGRIGSLPRPLDDGPWKMPMIRISIDSFGGFSGSAVVDDETGKMVGVLVGGLKAQMSLVLVVPARRVCALLDL